MVAYFIGEIKSISEFSVAKLGLYVWSCDLRVKYKVNSLFTVADMTPPRESRTVVTSLRLKEFLTQFSLNTNVYNMSCNRLGLY